MITRLVLLALIASASFAMPASAQYKNSMVDTQGLQPTTFYKDRLRLQRVPTAPIFTDTVRPDPPPMNIRIRTSPNAARGNGTIQVVGGNGTPVSTSNPMVPGLRDLPASQFDSKIPQGMSTPNRMLPNATTTNRLRGKMASPAQTSPPIVVIKNGAPNAVPAVQRNTSAPSSTAAMYPQMQSTSSHGGNTAKIEVRGTIKHKALLNRIPD